MARAPGATKLFFVCGSPFVSLCLRFSRGVAALEFTGRLPACRLRFLVPRRHRQARPVLTSSSPGYSSAVFSELSSLVYGVPEGSMFVFRNAL